MRKDALTETTTDSGASFACFMRGAQHGEGRYRKYPRFRVGSGTG